MEKAAKTENVKGRRKGLVRLQGMDICQKISVVE